MPDKYGAPMFTLSFRMNNAAFEDNRGGEVSRILRKLADDLADMGPLDGYGTIFDTNGNKIGEYYYDFEIRSEDEEGE